MNFIFYILAALLIYLSYKSFRGGINYLNYFKRELAIPQVDFTPFATVVVPCKGLDEGLKENLNALLNQDYAAYEMIFVVDDEKDSAVSVIDGLIKSEPGAVATGFPVGVLDIPPGKRPVTTGGSDSVSQRLGSENSVSARLVVATKPVGSSQKVENLREAVLHVSPESRVFVFADSDVRPSPDWLRHLVAPLVDDNVGAATGYRWFISKTPSVASELRSVWNASIASALGPNTSSNFCWGGSMAIRREVFEKLDIREKWRGTLSDDFTVTRAMNESRLPIVFVPQALTVSVENCTFREMLEFTTRQMKITRVYAPKLWALSFFGSSLFNIVMVWAFIIVVFSSKNDAAVLAALFVLTLVTFFSIAKSWLRLRAVKMVLPQYKNELASQVLSQNMFWILTPAVFFINSLAAMASRQMTWRGTTYEMVSPTETKIIRGP